jgi:hypothetical protein
MSPVVIAVPINMRKSPARVFPAVRATPPLSAQIFRADPMDAVRAIPDVSLALDRVPARTRPVLDTAPQARRTPATIAAMSDDPLPMSRFPLTGRVVPFTAD